MFKGKPTKVIMTGDAKEEFEELNKTVGEEISKGITSSHHQTLLNSVKQKIELLRENPEYGIHIPKDRIPKTFAQKITNLEFLKKFKSKSTMTEADALLLGKEVSKALMKKQNIF